MFRIYDGREAFYQWDTNQKLIVDNDTVNEVHFCTRACSEALVVEVKELDGLRVADVPNILLQKAFDLKAYAFCGDGYTVREEYFEIIERTKPTDYIYTETEVKRYDDLEEQIANCTKTRYCIPANRVDSAVELYIVGSYDNSKTCDLVITINCYRVAAYGDKKLNIPFEYDFYPEAFDRTVVTNADDFKPMIKNQLLGKGIYSFERIAELVRSYYESYLISISSIKNPSSVVLKYTLSFNFANPEICKAFYNSFSEAIRETDTVILEYTKPVEKTVELIKA